MNEPDLRSLPLDMPDRLAVPCRPVDEVIARGTARRRRRRAVRAAGVTSMAVALVAAGTLATGAGPDVVSDDPPAPEASPGSASTHEAGTCSDRPERSPVDPAQVDPELRALPGWLPDSYRLTAVEGTRQHGYRCAVEGPALVLFAAEGDAITSSLTVAVEQADGAPLQPNTQLRGTAAELRDTSVYGPGVAVEWVEADGSRWSVDGSNVDEATVRAVAEALRLDGTPAPGSAAADLPAEAIPAGFQKVRQVIEPAELSDDMTWRVTFSSRGDVCHLALDEVTGTSDDASLMVDTVSGMPGAQSTRVRGQVATAVPGDDGLDLYWTVRDRPDVLGHLDCAVDAVTAVRIAESLEPVEADDPRLEELTGDADQPTRGWGTRA